ncbi:ROK family protein [Bifidobacterium sp. ESL0732]|uniref:ROK family protein n=1 Tax=Bifidobacterium sp. ESL0732 TaxID=2983222 RepID=UPI0023FA23BE|nr:ROK family protein [Bifidobacterium sp. ESL0732]WEV64726.1 ROK family protein [Bifidobacterium sp. ESL0732]
MTYINDDSIVRNPTLPELSLPQIPSMTVAGRTQMLSLLCRLIASGKAQSKASLGRITGFSRSTITSDIDYLMRKGIISNNGVIETDRGRPANKLQISPSLGILGIADIGAEHTTLAIADMNLHIIGYQNQLISVKTHAPDQLLKQVSEQLEKLRNELTPDQKFRHCVIDLPGRIDVKTHELFRPPIMPGWDVSNPGKTMSELMHCPVSTDNDVNIHALGETAAVPADQRPLIAIKVATGIGAGIVDVEGEIFHGFDGSAGEIGHTSFDPRNTRKCKCGMTGCLETIASLPAMLEEFNRVSPDKQIATVEELIKQLQQHDENAQNVVRMAGKAIGQAVAYLCNILNPRQVMIFGLIAENSDELITQIRTSVYSLTRPLATRNLVIRRSCLGRLGGVVGCMVEGTEESLSPDYLFRQ